MPSNASGKLLLLDGDSPTMPRRQSRVGLLKLSAVGCGGSAQSSSMNTDTNGVTNRCPQVFGFTLSQPHWTLGLLPRWQTS